MPLLSTFGAASVRSFGGIGAVAAGAGLDVDEVYSTTVYVGNATTRNIQNGVDLTEGGLVWTKCRSASDGHQLYDTERGVTKRLKSESSDAQGTDTNEVTAFNSNGYTLNQDGGATNGNGNTYASWTWRKAPKFFTCLTYSGTGSAQNISHNLGSDVGFLLIKKTDGTGNWRCWHRGLPGTGSNMEFNQTGAYETATAIFNGTDPTSTQFSVGTNSNVNASGGTYVAYLFAHHANDGSATGFGPDGDSPVISCQSFTGGTTGTEVNVGFEPQFVMIKRAVGGTGDWMMFDAMRGVVSDPYPNLDNTLFANLNNAERTNTGYIGFTPTGFIHQGGSGDTNTNGDTYIYMAIRRGSLFPPEDATKVFGLNAYSGDGTTGRIIDVGFPVDLGIIKGRSPGGDTDNLSDRLRGPNRFLTATANHAENTSTNRVTGMDNMTGFEVAADTQVNYTGSGYGTYVMWGWKRAPSYFDMVAYNGTSSTQNVTHNLGVKPEMMWIKSRANANSWIVYHKQQGATKRAFLHNTQAFDTAGAGIFNNTEPTATQFTVATDSNTNYSGHTFIAYLFATAAGVSKVGSFSHTYGSTTNVDCGFSSGARFVLWKRYDGSRHWEVFDTARGLVSGNDPYLRLSATTAEGTSYDFIDPLSSGFQVGGTLGSGNFIFYAIA